MSILFTSLIGASSGIGIVESSSGGFFLLVVEGGEGGEGGVEVEVEVEVEGVLFSNPSLNVLFAMIRFVARIQTPKTTIIFLLK
jgi:hypothetical protein